MILPGSFAATLALLVISLLCLGCWANLFKSAGPTWRFELFCFDFAIGFFVFSIILALTLGSLGWDGFSFLDDLRLAGKRDDAFVFGAGLLFTLGNMLLLGGISLMGMSLAFPIVMGLGLVVGGILSLVVFREGNLALTLGALFVTLGAIVVAILAYYTNALARVIGLIREGRTKSTKKVVSLKGVFVCLAGGLFMGAFWTPLRMGTVGETALGPYAAGFVFAAGSLFSTLVYNLFFMNLPIEGEAIDIADYFRAGIGTHFAGLASGAVFCTGLVGSLVGGRADGAARVAPVIAFPLQQGAVVIASLCGLLVWRELAESEPQVKTYAGLAIVLLVVGIALFSASPLLAQ